MENISDSLDNKPGELTSRFNEAKAQLWRLNLSWIKCKSASTSGRLTEWKWELDEIWRELASDAKDKDEKRYFDENNKHNMRIAIAERKVNKPLLYHCLEQKHIFLRCLQDAVGKGSSKGHSDEDSFD